MCDKDRQLLDLISADPEAGIAAVLEVYGGQLLGRFYLYAAERGYGNANVEDVFQEALLRLLDPRERFALLAAGGCILPWLTRWGYWRLDDQHRRPDGSLDFAALNVPDPNADPSSELAGAGTPEPEPMALLRRAWSRLSPRDKLLLSLRYFQSYGEPELAAYLSTTPTAIKKALHDARQRLRRELEDEGLQVEE